MDVGEHHVHARRHDPKGAAREHCALVVEAAHEYVDAAPFLGEYVLRRQLAILEYQLAGVGAAHPQLVELLRGGKALHPLLDQKRGDTARSCVRVGLGVDDQRVGIGPVGDPHLATVENVAIALTLRAQAHRDHVGARPRLAHGERPHMLARDEFGKVLGFLPGVAVAANLIDAEVGVRPVRQADRTRSATDLLHGDDVRQIADARSAVLLFDRDPEESQITHLAPQIRRELIVAVDLCGARRDLDRGELLHRGAQHVDGLAKVEVQRGKIEHRQALWLKRPACRQAR